MARVFLRTMRIQFFFYLFTYMGRTGLNILALWSNATFGRHAYSCAVLPGRSGTGGRQLLAVVCGEDVRTVRCPAQNCESDTRCSITNKHANARTHPPTHHTHAHAHTHNTHTHYMQHTYAYTHKNCTTAGGKTWCPARPVPICWQEANSTAEGEDDKPAPEPAGPLPGISARGAWATPKGATGLP